MNDIREAFRLGAAGKIEIDVSLYGKKFSSAYLGQYMKAYEPIRLEKNLQVNQTAAPRLESDTRSEEEKLRDRYLIFENYVLQNKKLPVVLDIPTCFNYLSSKGLIDISPEAVNAVQDAVEERMLLEYESMKAGANLFDARQLYAQMKNLDEIDTRVKRKMVEDYLLSKIK